jgi:hypothetical protein
VNPDPLTILPEDRCERGAPVWACRRCYEPLPEPDSRSPAVIVWVLGAIVAALVVAGIVWWSRG